jgi:hypothetical protein
MKVTTIGIDLAKDVFGLHGVDGQGRVAFKKRLGRSRLWSTWASYRRVWWAWKPAAAHTTGRTRSSG